MKGVRIPKERIAVLIGTNGATKDYVESKLGVKLNIDAEGEVTIMQENEQDPLATLKALDVVKAIGRGFSPQHAYRLFEDMEYLDVIDIKEYVSGKQGQLERKRARVIGSNGKTRRLIEDLAGVSMSVYGSTVSVIGQPEQVEVARKAIDMLLRGSEHSTVYRFLERSRPKLRVIEMGFEP
ncbi:MAG TPA: KH domain-containing protein [Methanomassiliicoccales archaeon]|nr:KH domain-containing protein [Methanomassiliicoccales archaeon]